LNCQFAQPLRVPCATSLQILYSFLQGVVLLLLSAKMMHEVSFQPRLSVIYATLTQAVPELLQFFAMVAVVVLMFAMAINVAVGHRVPRASSLQEAITDVFQYTVVGSNVAFLPGIKDVRTQQLACRLMILHMMSQVDLLNTKRSCCN
jgi:Polycystin cation channel